MDTLSSAAAQGEQAYEPHRADGYNFTGADPSVRTLKDAVRHLGRQVFEKHGKVVLNLPAGSGLDTTCAFGRGAGKSIGPPHERDALGG